MNTGLFGKMAGLAALPLLALPCGCGPIRAGSLLIDAAAEVGAAKTALADKIAPYEYTAAESYLQKARYDHSYANYETAEDFARKSLDCARLARATAKAKTNRDIGASVARLPRGLRCRTVTLEDVQETGVLAPDEPPDPDARPADGPPGAPPPPADDTLPPIPDAPPDYEPLPSGETDEEGAQR